MKTLEPEQDPRNTEDIQSSSQASNEIPHDNQNTSVAMAAGGNSGSPSNTFNQNRNVSRGDIELVQNLIERCLQLYMNRGEVVKTLATRARIEPAFTTLVWKKLEEENSEFFRAYYIWLKLKRQIILFNQMLEHQSHLMKSPVLPNVPLAPIHNGVHNSAVNSVPIGYPVLHQPAMAASGQPHFDPTGCGLASFHVVNGIHAPGRFHPICVNTGNDIVMDGSTPEAAPGATPCGAISSIPEMAASPVSGAGVVPYHLCQKWLQVRCQWPASNNHFPFTPSEISEMGLDASALGTTLTSDVANSADLQLGQDCAIGSSRDSLGSLGQLWNLNLSDLTTDLANLADLGALEDYTGSPFLQSDSDILLDSPEHDDKVEEYFADAIAVTSSQPNEEKF